MKPVVIHVRYVQNDMDNRTHISSNSVRMYTQKIYMFLPSTSLYISFCHPDLKSDVSECFIECLNRLFVQ